MKEFRVEGPGEYRTRTGSKAVVLGKNPNDNLFPWVGYVEPLTRATEWQDTGQWAKVSKGDHDIIGPWKEPATREWWFVNFDVWRKHENWPKEKVQEMLDQSRHGGDAFLVRWGGDRPPEIIDTVHRGRGSAQ